MNAIKTVIICILGVLFLMVSPASASTKAFTHVKVIQASTASNKVDPQLKNIIGELESVFKYTSYRLLNQKKMNLGFGQNGHVDLPGKRTLYVEPIGLDGKRIRYQIDIRKNKKKIFQTKILLKNNNSITIGGPKVNKGVLLINISGSVR